MKIYEVVFTAIIGVACIRAESIDEAIEKLADTPHGVDSRDVHFQNWMDKPELLDITEDDLEELTPDEIGDSILAQFEEA